MIYFFTEIVVINLTLLFLIITVVFLSTEFEAMSTGNMILYFASLVIDIGTEALVVGPKMSISLVFRSMKESLNPS
ncbi:hypothetical protein [Kosmotoga pacifica]|uniref:Uncharacterized protein n=1 Tax=Kosmotoga pacifica TaxID=1330330 RepID=A0A0G2ZDM5_9BACT|nr:hypothetical protein [Kosmotoga pacifica]AKI96923.1 hypothetical protein IX53_02795 [Kosmotoga pacifica]